MADLEKLLTTDPVVQQYVSDMIEQVPEEERTVSDIPHLLQCLDQIATTAPEYHWDPASRRFFPMSHLFVYMMATDAGWNAFRNQKFNDALAGVLQYWYKFLSNEISGHDSRTVLNDGPTGWLSPPAYEEFRLFQFEVDLDKEYGGLASYNEFFHRALKDGYRPLPTDPKAIVSPNDGKVVRWRQGLKRQDQFWLKGQPYSLDNMLNGSEYVKDFVDGDVLQTFLSGADYHRWHAPVDGKVVAVDKVPGYMFAELQSMGDDTTAGTHSQCYGASVNTRGIVVIESTAPKVGLVCVMPVGITEISSITHSVTVDDQVAKGQEIGRFSFGGSSMCLLFQKGAVDHLVPDNPSGDPDNGAPVFVNGQIARAR
ncbi:phosphatidylserine decarboxylase [Streptomyces albospinus]|uniref:Phosphatidylserine decarboxylase n=1 Tax=Streptomyces albospinus TaxID=285515 RepID=A0ABQ2VMK3_9ACTN|nr:phosphatidylserine decarboxylase family protein [Streptomyces albospinus]GGU99668.1 phosphatidylserine decarboxylase [Streptomyces albospinus]